MNFPNTPPDANAARPHSTPSPPSQIIEGEWLDDRPDRRGTAVQAPPFTPYVVYTLIALNVLIFAVTGLRGGIMDTDSTVLRQFGMLYAPDIWDGEWWRLLSAMFLHGGLLH